MPNTTYFINGYFISPDGEAIEVKFENDRFKLSFVDAKKEIEFYNVIKHWWVTDDYALRKNGNDIELAKGNDDCDNSVIYKRIGIVF